VSDTPSYQVLENTLLLMKNAAISWYDVKATAIKPVKESHFMSGNLSACN